MLEPALERDLDLARYEHKRIVFVCRTHADLVAQKREASWDAACMDGEAIPDGYRFKGGGEVQLASQGRLMTWLRGRRFDGWDVARNVDLTPHEHDALEYACARLMQKQTAEAVDELRWSLRMKLLRGEATEEGLEVLARTAADIAELAAKGQRRATFWDPSTGETYEAITEQPFPAPYEKIS